MPKYWLCGFLMLVVPGLAASTLELIDSRDRDNLRRLLDYACGVVSSGRLPPQCKNKAVLAATLKKRYVTLGGPCKASLHAAPRSRGEPSAVSFGSAARACLARLCLRTSQCPSTATASCNP